MEDILSGPNRTSIVVTKTTEYEVTKVGLPALIPEGGGERLDWHFHGLLPIARKMNSAINRGFAAGNPLTKADLSSMFWEYWLPIARNFGLEIKVR